ncbi:hypothetical protein, partial [Lactobacillus helveticus]
LLSLSLNDKDLIRMYLYALAVIFIINYFLSFIKILPNFDLFGFGNKNAAGYFLCCFSFAILFILKKHKILKNIL